ncbi:hypothetical protein EMCRGX_G010470 [Ephydatia muelleri]
MLSSGSVDELIEYLGLKDNLPELFSEEGAEHPIVSEDHSSPGLDCIERHLLITHADLIAELKSKFNDDAEFPCCCCEHLCRRTAVSCVDFSNLSKYLTAVWLTLKAHILQNSGTEKLYICKYCLPYLNKNTMSARCVRNGLVTEPIPDELKSLDALSKQLIQRAKAFQTIVRLGTYSGKVPAYNALQACKGTMFFLPLPLNKTWETLSEVHVSETDIVTLPDPELFIILNGVPTKNKAINWLYKNLDDQSLDDAAKKVVEVVDKASSKMLEKASVDDIAALQSYTIRSLDQQGSALMDVEQYKMLNVKDDPIQSRQRHLDVMCFPTLFPSGQFGEFHPRDKHVSASEYAKSRLLNKDSRECSFHEASDLLLGDHLTENSETVKWVDVSMPHKRKRRLKSHAQLVEIEKNNPGSTDILEGSVVDILYPARPLELEDVCLYDFIKWYAISWDQ